MITWIKNLLFKVQHAGEQKDHNKYKVSVVVLPKRILKGKKAEEYLKKQIRKGQ